MLVYSLLSGLKNGLVHQHENLPFLSINNAENGTGKWAYDEFVEAEQQTLLIELQHLKSKMILFQNLWVFCIV